jgi:hypothetical protein
MECGRIIDTVTSVFTAIGTVSVAVLAIWGDKIKDRAFGPRLSLSLGDPKGDLTLRSDGKKVYYYHIKVRNQRRRNAATGVRIQIKGMSRKTAGGEFVASPLMYRLPLRWTLMEPGDSERTIVDESTCDFGNLTELDSTFRPALMVTPNNFRGYVEKDACVRFELVAAGQNVLSPESAFFQVSWDGQWTQNQEEMQRHLIIKEVENL